VRERHRVCVRERERETYESESQQFLESERGERGERE